MSHSHDRPPGGGEEEPLSGDIVPGPSEFIESAPGARHACPHGCDCWKQGFQDYIARSPRRAPDELDNQEAHALLVARNRAIRDVRRRKAELAEARRRVIASHGALRRAVARVRSLTGRGVLPGLVRRCAEESAREEPRPPFWLRLVQWPVVISAGVFDTWYFMQIFQQISLGNQETSWLDAAVSAVPGVVLAVGLITSGHLLGAPAYRTMRAHDAAQKERTGAKRIVMAWWPWPLRLLLPLLLVLVTGAWGAVRAIEANGEEATISQQMVGLLVMTLAVTAIGIKAAAHDPVGESRGNARRALWTVQLRLRVYQWLAHRHLAAAQSAWSDLCALRDEVIGQVRGRYGEAYEFMTYARGMHDRAGGLPPSFATLEAVEPDGETLAGWVVGDFKAVDQPPPEFSDLREVQRVIVKYDPKGLEDELAVLVDDASGQMAVAPRAEASTTRS